MTRAPMTRAKTLVAATALFAACRTEPTPAPSAAPSASAAGSAPVATASAPAGAEQALAAMDPRKPVPLLPMMAHHQKQNMRDHLLAVQQIVAGLAGGDFAAVEKAAGRIGYSEQMGAMCNHMGAGAPGFSEQAVAFHKTADGIGEAAKAKDRDKVLAALGTTLATCTGCHATWKQAVVDQATWQAQVGTAPPHH